MPSTQAFLPFHVPDLGEEEIRAATEVLKSGWLTTGPVTKNFEEAFRNYVGAKYAVAVNSCTAALHLALDAIGLKEGDEVILPSMTFAATGEVVRHFKAKPVLADCREDNQNLDVGHVESMITSRTRAIIPVHFAGHPVEMDLLTDLAKKRGLSVIEDAAHSLPARFKGRMVGTIGDMTCFSFYATKTITTGEGGMIVTDNPEYVDRLRMMSLHGISKDAWKRYMSEGSWYYEILAAGFKYNLTDLASAIGIEQLKKCDGFLKKRLEYAALYHEGFADLPEIRIPKSVGDIQHSWHLYVIQLELDRLTIDRAQFIEKLRKANVGTGVHFIPLHMHPYYRDEFGYRPEDLPHAHAVSRRILSLPIYSRMTEGDVARVIDAVRKIVSESRK
ncbi:MAG TPA: DegT/DnrJ/EryC1/StrS family aminotransferase [bacterium]|nr:DegT/DnrJ/EryC1/StrS family aminotransferase [bacterium]